VLAELQDTRVQDGILGDFAFDDYGDITPAPFTIFRMTGRKLVVDRVITVPTAD
jgi:hypothetical protein